MNNRQLTYADLDWNQLWKNARSQKGWASKGAKEWDKKSDSFATRNINSPFASLLIPHLPLEPTTTVLDIGSGPGTLALPIARQCGAVTAIDFSPRMLELLDRRAGEQEIDNISTVRCAWEDNWQEHGITPHDIAIAARSMGVEDLQGAIEKLNAYANRYVFIADRISPTPFDPAAFHAVGRDFKSGPDYIYTLNMLYSMGIHANVSILELDRELHFGDLDQAMLSYSWMIKDLSADEEVRLRQHVRKTADFAENGSLVIRRDPPPRWALIWWQKDATSASLQRTRQR